MHGVVSCKYRCFCRPGAILTVKDFYWNTSDVIGIIDVEDDHVGKSAVRCDRYAPGLIPEEVVIMACIIM